MGPIDFIVIGIVLLIVGLAAWYVIRAKKNGAKCIGCPSGGCNCPKASGDGSSCSCCSGCGGHGEKETPPAEGSAEDGTNE